MGVAENGKVLKLDTRSAGKRVVDLDKLDKPAGYVLLLGEEREVQHPDAVGYGLIEKMEADKQETGRPKVEDMWAFAASVLPNLNDAQIKKLKAAQVTMLIAIATEQIEAVQDFLKEIDAKNVEAGTEEVVPLPPSTRSRRRSSP